MQQVNEQDYVATKLAAFLISQKAMQEPSEDGWAQEDVDEELAKHPEYRIECSESEEEDDECEALKRRCKVFAKLYAVSKCSSTNIIHFAAGSEGLYFMRADGELYYLNPDGTMKIYKPDETEEIADSWSESIATYLTALGFKIENRRGVLSMVSNIPALNDPIIRRQKGTDNVFPTPMKLDMNEHVILPKKRLNDPVICKQRGEKSKNEDVIVSRQNDQKPSNEDILAKLAARNTDHLQKAFTDIDKALAKKADEDEDEDEVASIDEEAQAVAKFQVGDRVKTKGHNYIGTIDEVYDTCPQSNRWLSVQNIPIKAEDVRGKWYSILTEPSGAIVAAESDVELANVNE
jgi:heat shock protein HspQ